ncbi:beta/gamma crystallin family protein [Phenylobacterium deserti]|uniref:Beta/gamma crystallin 'Greek key' domain-containing protein n=1 Tax=Phenylobacterium deserti TaxID=1914756 RepID=A0A328ABX1_9CAUL|nr:beta/gamma crystallin family protein [Phenylobacterium deserti]RAK50844.1 hypothetical protein DJ018_16865 [Phenylobacterium deserti]
MTTPMMKTLACGLLGLALAGAADAQGYRAGGRGAAATLFEGPNFTGRSVTISTETANLSNYGFNDRARSIRLQGLWRLCEHSDFGGRCVEQQGDVPELNTMGLAERITSLQPIGGRGEGGRGPDRGGGGGWDRDHRDARGIEGSGSVFFPRPTVRGIDVAAGSNGANTFCRSQGLGPALYFDSSTRAAQAVAPEGHVIGRSTVLRDLLCRR